MTDQPSDQQPPDQQPPGQPASPPAPADPYAGEPAQVPAPPPPADPSTTQPQSPSQPYAAAPANPYAPQQQSNPYGGAVAAPAYTGGVSTEPGSLGYVQLYFGQVASFGQRVLALLIDTLLSLVGLIPMIIGFIVLAVAVPTTSSTDEFGNVTLTGGDSSLAVVGGLLIALGALLSLAIFIWNRIFRMGRTGQSVGKSVIGLKLVDDKTGQPIGAGMCFLREIVQGVVNQVFYLGYLWMLWDTDKQTVGDKSVHSTVVVLQKS